MPAGRSTPEETMRWLAFCLLAALSVGSARGDDQQTAPRTHYTPGDPHLRLYESYDSENHSTALWLGSVTLTGKLVVLVNGDRAAEDASGSDGYAVFAPDKKSRWKLPAATDRFACPVLWLWLAPNAEEILLPILGPRAMRLITHGKSNMYEVDVTLTTSEFRSEIYFFLKGNGRTYRTDKAVVTGHHPKVRERPVHNPMPGMELPYCD